MNTLALYTQAIITLAQQDFFQEKSLSVSPKKYLRLVICHSVIAGNKCAQFAELSLC